MLLLLLLLCGYDCHHRLLQIHVYNFPQDHSIKLDLVRGVGGGTTELTTIPKFQVRYTEDRKDP
jgi:hypothetical protein